MSKLLHRHYPLWVLMTVIFTIVTTIILPTIAGFFTSKLKDSVRDHFTAQLNDGAARMVASGFDEAELLAVEDSGPRILVFDERTQSVRYSSSGSTRVTEIGTAWDEAGARERPGSMEEAAFLYGLVLKWIGTEQGSFFVTDKGTPPNVNGSNLETKQLFLCGRSGDMIFCLSIPVEHTNEAVKSAINFTQKVSAGAWLVFVAIFAHSTQQISKRQRTIADIAARLARLDFSARCPSAFSLELNNLRLSINAMANSLEEHIDALKRTNRKLHSELTERIRQQKVSADLMANLAHDLKTPIAIISGYAEALADGMAKTPEKQEEYCETILRESERMQAIVSKLLSIGRMESGETPVKRVNFNLKVLIDDILNVFQREIERQGIVLTRAVDGACMVHTDYECVRQSLVNYVQNAIYHINNGNRIEIRLEDKGDRIRVRVTNSSLPIPVNETRKIWDKLYRMDYSRQRKHGETGLGLSIVKGNMERLGHAYGVENTPSFPGVCFWIELPKAAPEV